MVQSRSSTEYSGPVELRYTLNKNNDELEKLQETALRYYWQPTQPWNEIAEIGPEIADASDGIRIRINGKWGIDAMSGLVLVNVGHGRSNIVEAINQQLTQIHYGNTFTTSSPAVIQLAEKLASITPGDLNRTLFTSGGSEAVETALKIAYQYHVNRGEPQRAKFIARQGSYHGISRGALGVTSRAVDAVELFAPIMSNTTRLAPQPQYYWREDRAQTLEEFSHDCATATEDIILAEGPETFAAVIAEPISFSAGVAVPGSNYWPLLREICDKYGLLLIADEVINGFGRTGKWFGIQNWDVVPDLMTVAKGITSGYWPVGACIARDHVFDAFKGDMDVTYRHHFTYGGHPAGGAAGLVNLQIMEEEGLVDNAARVGSYLISKLKELESHNSVIEARGIGLLCALELVADKGNRIPFTSLDGAAKRLTRILAESGVYTRANDHLFIAPPLTTTEDDVDALVEMVDKSLTMVEMEFGLS